MKRALKFGILVAGIIAAWVALKHWGLHLDPSRTAMFDTVVFTAAGILGLFLGIKDKRSANGGVLTFGEGFKTGVCIAATYSVLTAIYFAILLVLVGPELMQKAGHAGPGGEMSASIMVQAFGGLVIGMTLIGAVLSVVVALVLRRGKAEPQ